MSGFIEQALPFHPELSWPVPGFPASELEDDVDRTGIAEEELEVDDVFAGLPLAVAKRASSAISSLSLGEYVFQRSGGTSGGRILPSWGFR